MATFTTLSVGSNGTRGLTASFPPRSCFCGNKLLSTTSTSWICARGRRRRSSGSAIKAMGGAARFKGTQMREKKLTELIEEKVKEAKQVCEGDRISDECKVAWDEVEEISQAKADLRRKLDRDQDPLESFCQENPETDECRIYDD